MPKDRDPAPMPRKEAAVVPTFDWQKQMEIHTIDVKRNRII